MDKSTVIGILIAIPLSILANLLTPVIKNGFALMSKKMTFRRIRILEEEMTRLDGAEFERQMFEFFQSLFLILMLMCFGLLIILLSIVSPSYPEIYYRMGGLILGLCTYLAAGASRKARLGKNPHDYRNSLEANIVYLKGKLQKRVDAEKPNV